MIEALRWRLLRAVDRFGAPAVSGVALAAAGAALLLYAVLVRLPAADRVEADLQRATQDLVRLDRTAEPGTASQSTAARVLSRSDSSSLQALSERMWRAARKAQIQVEEVTFDARETGGENAGRVTVRAQGAYAGVKRFLADLLNDQDDLVVGELQLSRHDGVAGQVDALIVLLHLGPHAGSPSRQR